MGNWIKPGSAAGQGGKPVGKEGSEEKDELLGNAHPVKRLPRIQPDA